MVDRFEDSGYTYCRKCDQDFAKNSFGAYVCPCGRVNVGIDTAISNLYPKIKVKKSKLDNVAKYIYDPELHKDFESLMLVLSKAFDTDIEIKKPVEKKVYRRRREIVTRNNTYKEVTIHRSTSKLKTICGSRRLDCTTTEEDALVTCYNCKLPKNQKKLRDKNTNT